MDRLPSKATVEDILTYKMDEIKDFLRKEHAKVSGSKLELAERAHDINCKKHGIERSLEDQVLVDCKIENNEKVPEIGELNHGWSGDEKLIPNVKLNDIENYLINSSHRTEDSHKMQCYRQYIRGLNFFKEGYIHKIMCNPIEENSKYCYIRSKCFPSMKQGVYEQWVLVTKEVPTTILRASCTCPAG